MRVIVIGATGHIGTYLIPRLVESGHEVTVISRKQREPYQLTDSWNQVQHLCIDRDQAEKDGTFGKQILACKPDAVIDLICFNRGSAERLVNTMRDRIGHLISCGTIWVHGSGIEVPITEDQAREPFGDYGIQKAAMEAYLLQESRMNGFPVTVLHPGHIVGPGWAPLNPAGNFNLEVFETIARGKTLTLPNFGLETVHHVHADDVAQSFSLALESPSKAIGESFHIVSSKALTLKGYATSIANWFGVEPQLDYLPWAEWERIVSDEDAAATLDHIRHSPSCSIEKARRLLNFRPGYSSLSGVKEALKWLIAQKKLDIPAIIE